MQRYIKSGLHSIVAGMTLALSGLAGVPGWTGEAQAATNASLIGELESVTLLEPLNKWSGGTMVVAGQIVTIPKNLLMDLPANRLTLQEIFDQAPAACKAALPPQSGLAKGDTCNPYGTGANVSLSANRTAPGGNLIAGDVFIQKGTESFAGAVTYINYDEGYFRLGGTVGNSTNGVMVRLNDPDSRQTIQSGAGCLPGASNCSPDVRFTLDPDNYTNVFTTGYPLCIPSTQPRTFNEAALQLFNVTVPGTVSFDLNGINGAAEILQVQALTDGTGDLLCSVANRTASNGLPMNDSRIMAPVRLGDNVVADGNWEIIGGVRFLSAHSTTVSAALNTRNLPDQPDYMFLNEVEVDASAFNNQRARSLIIGFVTLAAPTADVMIWSLHYDPTTNTAHELPLASVVGCEVASGAGSCAAQGLGGVAGNNIFKIRHDVDFNVGAGPKLNPCAHLLADPRMPRVCNNNATGTNIGEMFGILSPIPHEIQARTGHKVAFGDALITLDIQGKEATNGQYLFPFGLNLGGISIPEFDEIDLNAMQTPIFFSGIPWNLDRRLGPGGCDGPCEGTPQPLDPFPFEGLDPRTQTNLPLGLYNDPIFTSAPLASTPNRILSFVDATGRAAGNTTVRAWPPANPAAFAIASTPLPPVGAATPQAPIITSLAPPTGTQGALYTYQVTATDVNVADIVTISLVAPTPTGMTINATGLISWTPVAGQVGPNVGTVRATDQGGLFDAQSFIVTVAAAPPTANNDAFTTPVGTALNVVAPGVLVNDTNPTATPLTAILVAGPAPASGTLVLNANGSFTFTPAAGFTGAASFTYRASNGTLSNIATVNITVTAAAAPIAANDAFTTVAGITLNQPAPGVLVNDTPLPLTAIPLAAVPTSPVGSGSVTLNANGSFTYIPAAGFTGVASFTYQATNGTPSNVATVNITVTAAAAPTANNDAFATPAGTALNVVAPGVLGNDTNPTATPLTAILVAGPAPASGTLGLIANGSFTFTPAAGFTGAASFTYQASNGTLSNIATVTITVTPAGTTSVTGFILRSGTFNAQNRLISPLAVPLTNGTTISLAACGTCRFNIEALVSGPVNNVRNALTGATVLANNEGLFPFTLPGDAGVGNYNGMVLNLGAHTITATPFLPNNGPAGTPLTVTFTVVP